MEIVRVARRFFCADVGRGGGGDGDGDGDGDATGGGGGGCLGRRREREGEVCGGGMCIAVYSPTLNGRDIVHFILPALTQACSEPSSSTASKALY